MSINQMPEMPVFQAGKNDRFALSSERLEFLLQQSLSRSPSGTFSSFSSASPASSRDYLHSPQQEQFNSEFLPEEVYDFAFDQPLIPQPQPQPQPQPAGINMTSMSTNPTGSSDWFPLFNNVANGQESSSPFQSVHAPRDLIAPQPAPACAEAVDLGVTIKNFLDASPAPTPSSTDNTLETVHHLVNVDSNPCDENLDDLAKDFLRKFACARKGQEVSLLADAFREAGIEVPLGIMNQMDLATQPGMLEPQYGIHGLEFNRGDSQVPTFDLGYQTNPTSAAPSSSSSFSFSSCSSIGDSPISDWNFEIPLVKETSDSFPSSVSSSNGDHFSPDQHESSKVRSSISSNLNKSGVKKPRSGSRKRSPEGHPKCPECGKEFSRMFNMKTHLETHLSPKERSKPFVCSVDPENCSRGFSRRADLKRHQKTIHNFVESKVRDLQSKSDDCSSLN